MCYTGLEVCTAGTGSHVAVYCVQGIYVIQHQEYSWTKYSHLFGWHGVVVLSSTPDTGYTEF